MIAHQKRIRSFAFLGMFFLADHSAWANMRAPRYVPWVPSSAPNVPKPQQILVVQHENLTFQCNNAECKVFATYQIQAEHSIPVQLQFMLPVEQNVTVLAGTDPKPIAVALAKRTSEQMLGKNVDQIFSDFDNRGDNSLPIYQATTELSLHEGLNEVTFEYTQPLGAIEKDYGYVKKGRMVSKFAYLLWPLQEWKRTPNFQIDLVVQIARQPPSLWQRWFGKFKEIECTAWGIPKTGLNPKRQQRDGQYIYEATIRGEIPNVLTCYIGDDDLVKTLGRFLN